MAAERGLSTLQEELAKEEERRLSAQREAERRKTEQEENIPAIHGLEERVRRLQREVGFEQFFYGLQSITKI